MSYSTISSTRYSTDIDSTPSIPMATNGVMSTDGTNSTPSRSTPVVKNDVTSTISNINSSDIDSTPSTPVTTDRITSTRDNPDSSPIGVIIGGAAGGIVVVLLVGVAIITLCVIMAKIPSMKQQGIQDHESMELENANYAIYEGT